MSTDNFEVPLFGYITPPVVVFTIFTNTLTCIVLLKKHMRSPTNIILLSIALLDMFTGISRLPGDIYYYTLGYHKEYIPYSLCKITSVTHSFFSPHIGILHSASIWLTVVLALQRYISVCHPQVANRWCTIPKTIICIIVLCILAILTRIFSIILLKFPPIEKSSRLDPTKNITTCSISVITVDIPEYWFTLHLIRWWCQGIFVQLIPSFSLLVLNFLLIRTIRRAAKRRRTLLSQNRTTESRNLSESNRTTMLLVMVVGLFLMVELPYGVIHMIRIVSYTFSLDQLTWETHEMVFNFTSFFSYISFPLNIFIYCGMSRQFRMTFKSLFK